MHFEFCSAGVTVTLTFKYDRTVGFCRVCTLLEHPASGCRGPPDMTAVQVIGVPSLKISGKGNGAMIGSGRGEASGSGSAPNPNPSLGRGVRLLESSTPVHADLYSRPVKPTNLFQGISTPTLTFSLPGISSAELAAQASRFRSPLPVQLNPTPTPVVPVHSPSQASVLSGVKRGADSDFAAVGKKSKAVTPSLDIVPFELSFEPEMALAIVDGKIKVSPVKKRLGRPPGSKNRVKVGVGESSGSTGPHRHQKKKYKARKALVMDNSGTDSFVEVASSDSVAGVQVEVAVVSAGG